jgi:hypothetical protein
MKRGMLLGICREAKRFNTTGTIPLDGSAGQAGTKKNKKLKTKERKKKEQEDNRPRIRRRMPPTSRTPKNGYKVFDLSHREAARRPARLVNAKRDDVGRPLLESIIELMR